MELPGENPNRIVWRGQVGPHYLYCRLQKWSSGPNTYLLLSLMGSPTPPIAVANVSDKGEITSWRRLDMGKDEEAVRKAVEDLVRPAIIVREVMES